MFTHCERAVMSLSGGDLPGAIQEGADADFVIGFVQLCLTVNIAVPACLLGSAELENCTYNNGAQ